MLFEAVGSGFKDSVSGTDSFVGFLTAVDQCSGLESDKFMAEVRLARR